LTNLLVVQAHPLSAEKSRSVATQEAFIASYKKNNPTDTVTVLDIYKEDVPEIDAHLFETWATAAGQNELSAEQLATLTRFNELTEQFLAHDKIVETIFNFMGVTDIEHIFIEGVDHYPEKAEEIIAEAHKKAELLAETF